MSMLILFTFAYKFIFEFRENILVFTYFSGKIMYFSHQKVKEIQGIYFPKDALNPE